MGPGYPRSRKQSRWRFRLQRFTFDLVHHVAVYSPQSRLLHDEFAARNAERTNRNLYAVSALTAGMIATTVVTMAALKPWF